MTGSNMHALEVGLIHAMPPSDRRCLDRKEAASYLCVSPPTFDKLVRNGDAPAPIQFMGRKVWDKRALDRALDALSGIDARGPHVGAHSENEAPLDAWRRLNG